MRMLNNEDNNIEVQIEQGYSLHDLVTFASNNELNLIDSSTLADTNPRTIALFLERIDVDRQREVLRRFDPEKVSEIVSEMDPEVSAELVSEMREFRAVSVLNEMEPDDAADIVRELEEEDKDGVKDDIGHCTNEGGLHTDLRKALGRDKSIQTQTHLHENRAEHINIHIIHGIADGIFTGAEFHQERLRKKQHQ